jgi:hypothetical protein
MALVKQLRKIYYEIGNYYNKVYLYLFRVVRCIQMKECYPKLATMKILCKPCSSEKAVM